MLQQLDFATRAHHVPADSGRLSLFTAKMTPDKYVEFLSRIYSFEAPIEARWKRMPELQKAIDVAPRIRTPFLLSDLGALNAAAELLPAPNLVGAEQGLGWMYVVERGRRLNSMLYRHLMKRLPRELTIAGNYLLSSSPTGQRWHELGKALDKAAADHHQADQIINAAHRAFRALRMTPVFTGQRAA
ncbi:MAG: biliverdin-producing heme oxygenase [Kofleriaceae bacterium]|nr:biliverdin-producing heme oxygenase [Kofleriaceae bacterium]